MTLDIERLPGAGGTIGPLPDGTVIEVERIGWDDLSRALGWNPDLALHRKAEIIDAYNAAQGS